MADKPVSLAAARERARHGRCEHVVYPAVLERVLPPERAAEAVAYFPCASGCGKTFPLGPRPPAGDTDEAATRWP